MGRATRILAVTTAVGLATSVYLYLDNRSLKQDLSERRPAAAESAAKITSTDADPWTEPAKRSAKLPSIPSAKPSLSEEPTESRMERRQRRTREFSAQFGRQDGETEEEYRARIGPLISTGLAIPRMRASENRRIAEEKAGVTAEQSKKLDAAFDKVYADVLDYTNKAITDGQLSPYERNVAGWLDYAGGLGGMLSEANGQIGKILTPDQIKAMASSGFEWGEYLGLSAPWEQLEPPPPPKPNN